jgi:hypothetical protein
LIGHIHIFVFPRLMNERVREERKANEFKKKKKKKSDFQATKTKRNETKRNEMILKFKKKWKHKQQAKKLTV